MIPESTKPVKFRDVKLSHKPVKPKGPRAFDEWEYQGRFLLVVKTVQAYPKVVLLLDLTAHRRRKIQWALFRAAATFVRNHKEP
jgi:hypothetical protein